MHPTCALLVWLCAVLGAQSLPSWALPALLALALLTVGGGVGRWLGYVRRARWLLLSLWLIVAFNTPGEAWNDLPWAPTYEGVAEANLQVLRLLVLLACLAWLLGRLGRDELVGALWGLLQPLRAVGFDIERLVVRLSLVLGNLDQKQEKGAWRRVLSAAPPPAVGGDVLHLDMPRWTSRDSGRVLLAGVFLVWAVAS